MHLQLDKILSNGNSYKYNAFDNTIPIGFSMVRRIPSCSAEYPPQCKNHIYYELDHKYRGKGLGKPLLSLTIEEARKLGVEHIKISCLEDNAPSLKIIQNLNLRYIDSYDVKHGEARLLIFAA